MQVITTTELRTKAKELVKALNEGHSINLIHRSRVVGELKPVNSGAPVITDLTQFKKHLSGLTPKNKVPRSKRETSIRQHLEKKYG